LFSVQSATQLSLRSDCSGHTIPVVTVWFVGLVLTRLELDYCILGRRLTDLAISPAKSEWIGAQGKSHARGAPFHPQTQGKIEAGTRHRVLLENYFLPGDLERQIEAFIEHYNHRRTLHSRGHG